MLTQKEELFLSHYLADKFPASKTCEELGKTGKHTVDIVDFCTFEICDIKVKTKKKPKKTMPIRPDSYVPGSPEAISAMCQAYEQQCDLWDTNNTDKIDVFEDDFKNASESEIADYIKLEFEILEEESKELADVETSNLFNTIED